MLFRSKTSIFGELLVSSLKTFVNVPVCISSHFKTLNVGFHPNLKVLRRKRFVIVDVHNFKTCTHFACELEKIFDTI